MSDQLLDSWSDSQIKEWADKNGIKVPQGSKRNELIALARKHSARLSGNNVGSSASSAYGAATTSAGNMFSQATGDAYANVKGWLDWAQVQIGMGSDEAKSSLSSASSVASKSASESSKSASSAASSASKNAGKSGGKSAQKAGDAVTEAASSASNRVGEAAQKATDRVKEEL